MIRRFGYLIMNILITGSAGFIGKNAVEYFSSAGHNITTYDIKTHSTHPAIKGHDWILHFGAISSTIEQDVEKILAYNFDYSRWLLSEAIKYNINLQWSSSASVYGTDCKNFSEESPVSPKSPYAWSKYLFERHIRESDLKGILAQGFRYFNVYGKYEEHKGDQASPFHKFKIQKEKDNQINLFFGSDKYFRDFVPVEQVLKTHSYFLDIPESGIWNVGTGRATSFYEVAQSFNCPIKYTEMPEKIKKNYQSYTRANLSKIIETFKKHEIHVEFLNT